MRRSDREIKKFEDIVKVIEKCDVCRLALNDDGYPYILPLNFGYTVEGERITFYFHGATEGRKYELISKDNRVSFEMDCSHRLVGDIEKRECTYEYESVIGRGRIEILDDDKKFDALTILMNKYYKDGFDWSTDAIPHTNVMKLTVESITGKSRMKRNKA